MKSFIGAFAGGLLLASASPAQDMLPGESLIEFEPQSGEAVSAYRGFFEVPENRADPDSRLIEIGYVRFPATTDNPGSPIIYLSGGPGGSGTGTARGQRFPLFMEMRQHGDVIAFDQRGTGLSSNGLERCTSDVPATHTRVVTDEDWSALYQQAALQCREVWQEQGIDLAGYTTLESVADIDVLRLHLGSEQVSLWGISYGTHLALAAIERMDDRLDRVILASAEGMDQTVKLPEFTASYFERLQAAVNSQPEAAAAYPDIAGLINRVNDRLAAEPVLLEIPRRNGEVAPFLLQRHHLQTATGGLIADPQNVPILLALYTTLDQDDVSVVTVLIQRFLRPSETIGFNPMSLAMDRASGITSERLQRFENTIAQSPVGAYLNAPMPQLAPVLTELDLGDEFRTQLSGRTPVLLITGSLDGRTYVEEQSAAVEGLENVEQIHVVNAGHNLFMTSPEVAAAMHHFMRGEAVQNDTIVIELPDFSENPLQ
jgi:pimeloyl-ACP methyl ester carboxylesterase